MGALKNVLVRKSNSAAASTPDLRANAKASPSDSSTVAIKKFPVSFTTFALDCWSPMTSNFCPMASHTGLKRSIVAFGPAATTASFPASAASGRPNTAAAMYSCPAPACSTAKRSLSATLMVLSEMCARPRASDFNTPPSPNTTASTAASSASMVSTASPRHASAKEPATVAPSLRSASARSRVRLYTVTRCPARSKLFAIPVPILPNPINPTSITSSRPGLACSYPLLIWHDIFRLCVDRHLVQHLLSLGAIEFADGIRFTWQRCPLLKSENQRSHRLQLYSLCFLLDSAPELKVASGH